MKIKNLEQYERVIAAEKNIQEAQSLLAGAGLGKTPTFYKLTSVRGRLKTILKQPKPHRAGCLCPCGDNPPISVVKG
jgi:hypothetical protein